MKKIVLVLLLFSLTLGLSFIQDNSYAVDLTLPYSLGHSARHTATNVTDVFEFVKDGDFFVLSLKETPAVLSGKLSYEFDAGSLVGWYANGSSTLITTSTESQPAHLLTYLDLSGAYVDTGEYKITMSSEITYSLSEQEITDNGEQDIRFVFRSAPSYYDLFYGDTKKINASIEDTSNINDVQYLGSTNLFNSIDSLINGDDSINIDFLMDDELLPGTTYEYVNNYEEFYSNKVTAKDATYGAFLEKNTVSYIDSNLSLFDGEVYLLYTSATTSITTEYKINSVIKSSNGPTSWVYNFNLERLTDNLLMMVQFRVLSSDTTKYSSIRPAEFPIFNINDTIKFATASEEKSLKFKLDTVSFTLNPDGTMIDKGFFYTVENTKMNITFDINVPDLLPWDLSYAYGKIRTQTSNDYFYQYHELSKKVYLQTSSGSSTFNPSLIQANEVITLQSPYKNFQVNYGTVGNPVQYLVNISDVSVVQIHKLGTSSLFNFYVYHWVDGEIEISTFLNVDLSNRNSLKIEFSGGIRQALSGNAIIIGNVDDLNDITYYTDFLIAWDDIDGDISDSIYVIDDGDYLGSVVGTYTITAGVKDSENQETTFTFAAVVADNVAPTLVAPNLNQTIAYTATYNLTTYLASLVKDDNYYESDDITITIQENDYTANKAIPGIYDVVLRVKDPYNNYTDYTLKITVTDPVAPTFTSGLATLSKSINEQIMLAQILATQVATDAIDGNVSSSITVISDGYTGNETIPGTYTIVIEASDLSGNKIQKTITINVFSGVPGWYLPDDGPIIIPNGSQLTFEQIKAVLVSVGWIAPDIEVTLLSSTYFGNEDKPGTYKLNLSLDGVPTEFDLLVLNQGDNWFPDVPNPPLVAQPNITLIIGSVVAAIAVVGTVLFIITKKRKA